MAERGIRIHVMHACSQASNHLIMRGDCDRSFALRIPFPDIYSFVGRLLLDVHTLNTGSKLFFGL